jgi:hypothetical protein
MSETEKPLSLEALKAGDREAFAQLELEDYLKKA